MAILIQLVGVFIATIAAGLILEIPRHLLFRTAWIGLAGYGVYLLAHHYVSIGMSTLLAGIVIAAMAQVFSRIFKAPVTMFYIPSFFPLVPGTAVYYVAYYYIQGEHRASGQSLLEAGIIAGAIALSIFIVDSVLEVYTHLTSSHTQK